MTLLTRLVRPALRHYPFKRGKALITRLLRFHPCQIPDGRVVRTRHGLKVRVHADGMYTRLFLFGEYEPANSEIYRKLVRPGDLVFDIGANFGWYTGLLARQVGPRGKVHAFEPLPTVAALTRETIAMNGLEAIVELTNEGVGSESGTFTVYTFKDLPHGHASATDLGRADAMPHLCHITTLDEYVATRRMPQINFIKVDVEGHELEVFKGATRTLSATEAPIVSFEINRRCLDNRGIAPTAVSGLLRNCGYSHFWAVNPFGGATPVLGDIGAQDCDYLAAKANYLNRVRAAVTG